MSRKKRRFNKGNDDYISHKDASFREKLLKSMEPIIPFNVELRAYEYVCVVAGPAGRAFYPDLNFVMGETYYIKKSRWSVEMVEICGPFWKANQEKVHVFNSFFKMPLECCKKHLKIKT